MRERDLRTMDLPDADLAEQLVAAERDAETKFFGELVGIDPDEDDDEQDDFAVDDGAWRLPLVEPLRKIEYRDDPKGYASPLRLGVVGDSAAWTN